MKYVIWITLAPRPNPTINECLKAIRDAGFNEKIYIFAEPGDYQIEDENVEVRTNIVKLWCFKNYNNMVEQLLELDVEYIATRQDDFIIKPEAYDKFMDMIDHPCTFWYFSYHTRPRLSKYVTKNWWNNIMLWRQAWWMEYVFRKDVLQAIINHPFYQSHLLTYKKNQQIDACVSEVLKQMNLPNYYHNPSLSTHRWESTIWHIDNIMGDDMHIKFDDIVCWVASIPSRTDSLKIMIDSIYHQCDRINVYLNWYTEVPAFLKWSKIKVFQWEDLWDAGKFFNIENEHWYYFAMDDDLSYATNYCETMISHIENYNRMAVIGTHGVVPRPNIEGRIDSYYKDRYVFHFNYLLPSPVFVPILGTGWMAFHTDTIKLKLSDFKQPNMADIYFWLVAQKQTIPMICIDKKWPYYSQLTVNESIRDRRHNGDDRETEVINTIKRKTNYLI